MKNFLKGSSLFLLGAVGFGVLSAQADAPQYSIYGFILPTVTASGNAVESFSQANSTAYTAAANPALAFRDSSTRSQFQVAQSRLGSIIKVDPKTQGLIEIDFFDATKSTPTVQSTPRLRRAYVDYQISESTLFRFGQDWDLVSPEAPYTYNKIGHYFLSGDIGFMRIQAQLFKKMGNFEHAIALGMPGITAGATQTNNETSVAPSVALRESYQFSDGTKISASAIAGRTAAAKQDSARGTSYAASLSAKAGNGWLKGLVSEAYVAQNGANLGGLQALGYRTSTSGNVREVGGYATYYRPLTERWTAFVGYGRAQVLEMNRVTPSYTLAAGTRTLGTAGPGIKLNQTARFGLEKKLTSKLKAFFEYAYLRTTHALLAADSTLYGATVFSHVGTVGLYLEL